MTDLPLRAEVLPRHNLSVVSDTICPWCFIGKRRLEQALQILAERGMEFDVDWRPYQLNPDIPDRGLDRREYRSAKFGWERSLALDAQVVLAGKDVGIDFRYDLVERTPNTLASHVMLADARRAGGSAMQGRAAEALFTAYFTKGLDVGQPGVLRDIASTAGFEHGTSVGPELWEVVQQEDQNARAAGYSGVPSFLLDGHYLLSGAQPVEVFVSALTEAVSVLHQLGASTT